MKSLAFLLNRKIVVGLFSILIVLTGVFAFRSLELEMMPNITMDIAAVQLDGGELNVLDMESSVTSPVEEWISQVEGIESFTSTTTLGQANLQLTLTEGEGEEVIKEVEVGLSQLVSQLTPLEDARAFLFTTTSGSDMFYDFYGDASIEELGELTENVIKPRLMGLTEVGNVSITGAPESEVTLTFDEDALEEEGLSIRTITQHLTEAERSVAIGRLPEEEGSPRLRWNQTFEDLNALESFEILSENGISELGDYAEVSVDESETQTTAWKDGRSDFISVSIDRSDDTTPVALARTVRTEVEKMKEEGILGEAQLQEFFVAADMVSNSLSDIQINVAIGGLLSLVILFAFLRNVKATSIIAVSIPLSILLTLTFMYVFGYSLNIITLIALGLGIGMMVDSTVVILESIYRKLQAGYERTEAVLQGTKEVSTAVISSMLTTVVVFLPIGILSGDLGKFILALSVVIVLTLLSSCLVSFTLIPVLAAKILKHRDRRTKMKESRITKTYGLFIEWMTFRKWRYWTVSTGFFFIFITSFVLIPFIPTSVIPDLLDRQSEIIIDLENDVTQEEVEEIAEAIHLGLTDVPDVDNYSVLTLDEKSLYVLINMTRDDAVTLPQGDVNKAVMDHLETLESDYPVDTVAFAVDAGSGGHPIAVRIQGEDLSGLQSIAIDLEDELKGVEGISGLHHSMGDFEVETIVVPNKEALSDYNLSTNELYPILEDQFYNFNGFTLNIGGNEMPVYYANHTSIQSSEELLETTINTSEGNVEIGEFISLENEEVPETISRRDGEHVVTLMAGLEGRDLGSVSSDIKEILDSYEMPAGYGYSFGGEIEHQQDMFIELFYIFVLSVLLVYLVLAIQFNHLIHPLVVMSLVPFAITGALLGLFITQMDLNLMSAMGIIILMGIVLNNSVLFIDRTKQLRQGGMNRAKALEEAGKNRMRPIFMTTFATAAAMLPLAIATGSSSSFQVPLAVVIIFGLLFSTLITLFLVPAVYMIMEDIIGWPKRFFNRKRQKGNQSEMENMKHTG
ncbi:efflux RND transporter permease subunit [Alteribacter populi]|uniref:efflux RND transporter permease subunit n=1 Tax=Alteribacter populi TaxID=2011011 RepID=UPI000BBB0D31|nr:efflux RND transporter permease subunit [Alteribacter populi]